VRTFNQRTVLDMFAARITAVSLSGYMFFGRWAAGTRALAPKIA
jgi:SulP family sulfate permease